MKLFFIIAISIMSLFSFTLLNAQNMDNNKEIEASKISDFPIGNKLPEMYSKYFIGQAYLAPLTHNKELNVPISNVTFEPGCRNNWHSHTGGPILVVVGGEGWYQDKGKPAQLLKEGDVVEIGKNVVHWHGATADSWFSHLAIECNPQYNENTWLEPVNDAEYAVVNSVLKK